MKKFLKTVLLTLFIVAPAYGEIPARLTVVELFTSQGCSSCPPADAILKTMRDRPQVLTLSWPVDYWDRLGWEDTFADPYNSMRQMAYNKRLGRGGVFTPQLIIDGNVQSVGSVAEEVRKSIEESRDIDRPHLSPFMRVKGDQLLVTLENNAAMKMVAVRIVWYLADADVQIGEGENEGRTLHYTNVVLESEVVEDWDGTRKTYSFDLSIGRELGADHAAILLQEKYGHGPIVGANFIDLPAAESSR
jgi:hypothetical protein